MSSKKKLITAITSLAVVAVIAVVAVTVTLAALNATVTSGFNIKYTALNVNATVTAKYGKGAKGSITGESAQTALKRQGENPGNVEASETEIKFTSAQADQEVTASFETVEIVASAAEDAVVYAYTFKNDDATNKLHIVLQANISASEFTVTYGTSAEDITKESLTQIDDVEASGETTIYIKFVITDPGHTKDATVSGSISWNLTSVAPVPGA